MANPQDALWSSQPGPQQPLEVDNVSRWQQLLQDMGLSPHQVQSLMGKVLAAQDFGCELCAWKRGNAEVMAWFASISVGQVEQPVPESMHQLLDKSSTFGKCKEALTKFEKAPPSERRALAMTLIEQYQEAYMEMATQLVRGSDVYMVVSACLKTMCDFVLVSQLCCHGGSRSRATANLQERLRAFHRRYVDRIVAYLLANAQEEARLHISLDYAQEDLDMLRQDVSIAVEGARSTRTGGLWTFLSAALGLASFVVGLRRGLSWALYMIACAFALRFPGHRVETRPSSYGVVCSALKTWELQALSADCEKYAEQLQAARPELCLRQ